MRCIAPSINPCFVCIFQSEKIPNELSIHKALYNMKYSPRSRKPLPLATFMRPAIRAATRVPKLMPTPPRRLTRHVIASTIFLNGVVTIRTWLAMLAQPLYRFGRRGTVILPVICVATLCTVATSTFFARAGDATIAHILFGDNGDDSAFTMEHGLGRHSNTSITTILSMFNH